MLKLDKRAISSAEFISHNYDQTGGGAGINSIE